MTNRNYIIVGALIGLVIGVFYSIIVRPVYKAESNFRIGSIGIPIYAVGEGIHNPGIRLLEDRGTLRQILYTRYRIHEARLNRIELPFLYSATAGDGLNIINLSARGQTPEQAEEFLKTIINWVIERHKKKYEIATNQLNDHSQFIKQLFVEGNFLNAINQSKGVDVEENKTKDTISTEKEQSSLGLMLRTVAQSQLAMLNLDTHPTEIVAMPRSSGQKIEPKTLLYILTGLIVGIVAAVSAIGIYKEVQTHRS